MIHIHNFGMNNVIDLECLVLNSAPLISRGRLEIPYPALLAVKDLDNIEYYAEIMAEQNGIISSEGKILLKLNEKYDLAARLSKEKPQTSHDKAFQNAGFNGILEVRVDGKSGGGGAHNAAYGQGIFLQGAVGARDKGALVQRSFGDVYNIRSYLHVMYGDPFIEDKLPPFVTYHPICDCEGSEVERNVNIPIKGEKIIFRSKPFPYDKRHPESIDSYIKKGDVLFVNTVKDRDYLEIAYAALRTGKIGKCIVAATDSMIDKLGADEIRKLVGFSDVYISNVDELERLTQTEITDNPSLARAMDKVRDMQLSGSRDGKKPHVYVTFGENGAAVMDTSGNVFYQPTMNFQSRGPLAPRIVNTNGCGDAFAGIAATLEASGFPTLEILDYANCAGQICTQHNGASGNFLATPEKISEFKKQYSSSPIKMYDRPQQDFIGGIIVNCRFD